MPARSSTAASRRTLETGTDQPAATLATPEPIQFGTEIAADFTHASALEWLESDGLGGWASTTLSGAHTRRYHGLLVAATRPPAGRRLLVSRLDETVVSGGERIELGANRYPGAIHPQGFRRLESFELDTHPCFTYRLDGCSLRKEIVALTGRNAVAVTYERLADDGEEPLQLELRPLLAGRDIHALARATPEHAWEGTREETPGKPPRLSFRSRAGEPTVHVELSRSWSFASEPCWYYAVQLTEERARGFDFEEDLHAPGVLRVELARGQRLVVLLSTEEQPCGDLERTVEAELARRRELVARAHPASPLAARLALAADQFLVRRGTKTEPGWSVIAGYPWFADWGRDAMIALPGLALETGRFAEARGILAAFCAHLSQGMLPNRFPEAGEEPEYNTVDATLWLFVAAWRYLEATGDEAFVRATLLPALDDALTWHARGTRFGIRVDADGLLLAGEPGVQLTWMDAKVGDRVITPRQGKPVEIEALWANALWIAAKLHQKLGDPTRGRVLSGLARRVRERFEAVFWNEGAASLFDVVAPEGPDASVRPNQIFALSLPYAMLSRERALAVLATVERQLVTPRGLRSLTPSDPAYVPRYEGGPAARDAAYHQGTVWSWLAGPYVDALARYRGAAGKRRARAWLAAFAPHLREACVGQVSEIFDAEPPHAPRGAVAQAWSVGELLRACRVAGLR